MSWLFSKEWQAEMAAMYRCEGRLRNNRVLAVAKAIEGPHMQTHVSRDKLTELRDVRWQSLTDQERGLRYLEAQAAITQWESGEEVVASGLE